MKGCVCSGVFIGSHAHVPAVAVIGSYDQRILDTNLGDSGFSALLGIGPAARPGAAGGCWRPRRSPRKRRTNLAVSSLGERQFRGYDAERFRTARRTKVSLGRISADRQLLSLALDQLRSAIDLLDRGHAPSPIAAHVDLAIHQLADAIGSPDEQRDRLKST